MRCAARLLHSYLNAISGSTCVARRAGTRQAAKPTATSTASTAPKVRGSFADTPHIWLRARRVRPRLANSPVPMPMAIIVRPRRNTIFRTSRPAVLRVGNDADDFEVRISGRFRQGVEQVELDRLSERIVPAEEVPGERLIHDDDAPSRFHIALGKQPPAEEPNAKRLEVPFAAQLKDRGPRLLMTPSRDGHFAANAAVGWQRARFRPRHHAGQRS